MSRLIYIFHQLKHQLKPKHYFTGLTLLAALLWLFVLAYPDDKLHLIFCDVGQGDAILISRRFNQVLIDGGPDESVLSCLSENMPFWDRKIEIVALTHPQADHLTGLLAVLERYKVGYFLAGPEGNESAAFGRLKSKIENRKSKMKVINPYTGNKIKIGGIILETLWPEKAWVLAELDITEIAGTTDTTDTTDSLILGASTSRDLNQFSLVFQLKFGDFDALLAGDADGRIQDEILKSARIEPVEILKVPHHGSKYAFTEGFLEKVQPRLAIISVGKNSFGHPAGQTIQQLNNLAIKILRTDQEGTIKIVSDGEKWGIVR